MIHSSYIPCPDFGTVLRGEYWDREKSFQSSGKGAAVVLVSITAVIHSTGGQPGELQVHLLVLGIKERAAKEHLGADDRKRDKGGREQREAEGRRE